MSRRYWCFRSVLGLSYDLHVVSLVPVYKMLRQRQKKDIKQLSSGSTNCNNFYGDFRGHST